MRQNATICNDDVNEDIIEVDSDFDEYAGDDFELSADDEKLIAMLSEGGSKSGSAVANVSSTTTFGANKSGSGWEPPRTGGTIGAVTGSDGGGLNANDLDEEILEESLSQEFVDFDSVRVEDS